MKNQGLVGVVVVHFGDPTPTLRCLASVFEDPSPVPRRVVVVDNSGTFSAPERGESMVLRLAHNPGFGAGANAGIDALGSDGYEALVVLNHDVELLPGFLEAVRTAVARPQVGAAGGPLYLGSSAGPLWYAGGHVNFLLGTVAQSRSRRRARQARRVGFLPGAALAVSPQAWWEVGGFDPTYFLYNEDLDFSLRLRRRGYALYFEPAAAAIHHLGVATGSAARSPLYLEHLTQTRLRPFRPNVYRLYLAGVHTAYVGIRAALLAATGGEWGRAQARALLRGHGAALKEVLQSALGSGGSSRRRADNQSRI